MEIAPEWPSRPLGPSHIRTEIAVQLGLDSLPDLRAFGRVGAVGQANPCRDRYPCEVRGLHIESCPDQPPLVEVRLHGLFELCRQCQSIGRYVSSRVIDLRQDG